MAIALDSVTSAAAIRNAGSLTFAHTCVGTGVTLYVLVDTHGGTADPSSVTYNGTSMTSKANATSSNRKCSIWELYIGTGDGASHNVVITAAVANGLTGGAISLSGTASTPTGATNNTSATSTTYQNTITTTHANAWILQAVTNNDILTNLSATVAGSTVSQFAINTDATTGGSAYGASLITSTAGSYTIGWSGASDAWCGSALEVIPTAVTVNSNFLMFM